MKKQKAEKTIDKLKLEFPSILGEALARSIVGGFAEYIDPNWIDFNQWVNDALYGDRDTGNPWENDYRNDYDDLTAGRDDFPPNDYDRPPQSEPSFEELWYRFGPDFLRFIRDLRRKFHPKKLNGKNPQRVFRRAHRFVKRYPFRRKLKDRGIGTYRTDRGRYRLITVELGTILWLLQGPVGLRGQIDAIRENAPRSPGRTRPFYGPGAVVNPGHIGTFADGRRVDGGPIEIKFRGSDGLWYAIWISVAFESRP